MSFYRSLLASVAAIAIASPVFADDAASSMQSPSDTTPAAQTDSNAAMQPAAEQQSASETATETKVNLNKATAKELMKVKGINAARARAIVSYRKHHEKDGGFKSVDELSNVKGFKKMKPDMMKSISDQVTAE